MPRAFAGDLGHRVDGRRDVLGGELALQGKRRGGDDDALAVVLDEPDQRGGEVAERLAGAGAGLDQQVAAAGKRVGDGVGHLELAGPLGAADLGDGLVQDGTVP